MKVIYGFSDFVGEETPAKYQEIKDKNGNVIGEVECYFVDEADEEE